MSLHFDGQSNRIVILNQILGTLNGRATAMSEMATIPMETNLVAFNNLQNPIKKIVKYVTLHNCEDENLLIIGMLCLILSIICISCYIVSKLFITNIQDSFLELYDSVSKKDIVKCLRLLQKYPQIVNMYYPSEGYTPFLKACLNGSTQIVQIMLESDNAEPVSWVPDAINKAIQSATQHLSPNDQVGMSICSKGFAKGEGWVRFREASALNTDDVWNVLVSLFQSNSMGFSTDTFCLGVTSVRMPVGRGGGTRVVTYNSFTEECSKRTGIVTVKNTDNLCLPRALVVAMANVDKNPDYTAIRQDTRKMQTMKAQALIRDADVTIPEDGCGIPELQRFQEFLKDYTICVYLYGNKGRDVMFQGLKKDKKINLLYHKGHYNVITSLTAAFTCVYFCEDCHIPYNDKNGHRCGGICCGCHQSPACPREVRVKCPDCHRTFNSQTCLDNHKRKGINDGLSVCQTILQCEKCLKTVRTEREHICGEIYCKICKKHLPQTHQCHMLPDKGKPQLKDFVFVFYDLETTQEEIINDKGSRLHRPNLCVYKTCCEECIDSGHKNCGNCGHWSDSSRVRISSDNEYNSSEMDPVDWLVDFILTSRQQYKTVVVIAHNGQSFDHQFILNYIITKTDLTPELIMRGTKLVQMTIGNVKLIDSLNYFPMALSKLPKAFGLPDIFKKGYFPHMFNTAANSEYVGPLPALENYSPDTMMGTDDDDNMDERKQFLKWYEEHREDVFDFKKELVDYCVSDVEILTEACLKFRREMLTTSKVCPFTESCTIASTCNKVFRRNFLRRFTIGIIPKGGYRYRDNQSQIAIQWLVWEEHQRGIDIAHAAKGRERIIGGLKVDGFCAESNKVFEFHGCFYHGCEKCFKFNRDNLLHDEGTLNLRQESTIAKTERLRQLGYEVHEMWECEFRRCLVSNPEIQAYTFNHPMVQTSPLNPRDAFYGGRTGNCVTYYECQPGEKIKYIDICSLYPWVCKYGKFPVGHPKVHVGDDCLKLQIPNTEGLIKCTILPPQDLYHPVLPVKMNNKLMFVLCKTCGEVMSSDECNHNEEERALSGTWVIDEVRKALEMGYQILKIHEIWKYNQISRYDPERKSGGLFTEMMNEFICIKQQASGWPGNCVSDKEKNDYIEEFFKREGIKLNFDQIVSNPGHRSLAKLILNSFWGKLGQRENQPKTVILNQPEDLFSLLTNPSLYVNGIVPINEDVVVVNYEFREETYDSLTTVNVALAAYTTAQARLKLYSYLERLGNRVLYYDTDSVIYISRDDEADIPTGSFLGDMTDELEEYGKSSYITRFVSGGPKNYAYEVYATKKNTLKTVVKVKGIRINYEISKLINFHSIKDMIIQELPPLEVTSTSFRRTKCHEIVTVEEKKKYRPNSTKRRFGEDFDSVPYGYKKQRN